jgi:hypothetical protein
MAATHRCAATGCRVFVSWRLLMCPRHWRQVPTRLQTRVYRAWNDGETTDDYPVAVAAAVAAVASQGDLFAPKSHGPPS